MRKTRYTTVVSGAAIALLAAGCGGGSSGSSGSSSASSAATSGGAAASSSSGATSAASGSAGGSAAAGSGIATQVPKTNGKKYSVEFIEGAKGNDFYVSMACGINAEAKKIGNVSVTTTGPDQFDASLQTPIVRSVIAKHPDGVLIAPDDATAMIPPLKDMKSAGIPFVEVDTHTNTTGVAVTKVSSDNVKGGSLAADYLANKLHQKGSVLVESLGPGVTTDAQRVQGFQQEIKKYPNIKLVSVQYTADDTSKAASIVQSELAAHSDLAGIFATDLLSAQGAATGLQNSGKQKSVTLVGFDAGPQQVQAIQQGSITAVVSQTPYNIGVQGLNLLIDSLSGKKITQGQFNTPLKVIDKSNLNAPSSQEFIYKTNC